MNNDISARSYDSRSLVNGAQSLMDAANVPGASLPRMTEALAELLDVVQQRDLPLKVFSKPVLEVIQTATIREFGEPDVGAAQKAVLIIATASGELKRHRCVAAVG